MVSHANAHPNFVVLFMIPLIIDRALRLTTGERVVRDGVVLGLMAAYQVFLGEEPLLLAALGMLVFAVAYGAARPAAARAAVRPLLNGLAIAAAVCLPLVVYPLAWQFSGPQSYSGIDHGSATGVGNSLRALLSFAERSLVAGDAGRADALSLNPTEQNAFYGWPLVLLAFAVTVALWRRPVVRALACTAAAAAVLSLGPRITLPLTGVTVPGPWAALAGLPLFESVIESRVALVCAPALGMLLALAVDRLARARRLGTQYAGLLAVCLALLPLIPAPLKSGPRPPRPPSSPTAPGRRTSGATRRWSRCRSPSPRRPRPCTGRRRPASASGCPAATSTAPTATATAPASTASRCASPRACCGTCGTPGWSRWSTPAPGPRPARTSRTGGRARWCWPLSGTRPGCVRRWTSWWAARGGGWPECGYGTCTRGRRTGADVSRTDYPSLTGIAALSVHDRATR